MSAFRGLLGPRLPKIEGSIRVAGLRAPVIVRRDALPMDRLARRIGFRRRGPIVSPAFEGQRGEGVPIAWSPEAVARATRSTLRLEPR